MSKKPGKTITRAELCRWRRRLAESLRLNGIPVRCHKAGCQGHSPLAPEVRDRLRDGLEKHREDPLAHARKMVNSSLGGYRFRIGDYRVVFDIDGDSLVILRVGHRRDIYRG
ncbi:MAG: type II toxin-antitoxin system RelE/ParE family toxin [Dehalococcoidia bacterium]|nr:type II toxin-antitoxin system RelE/ParE family toxin [Dehalococcoidia bacterium]